MRWEDCVRRDIPKVGVVGEWRELGKDTGRWRSIMVKTGQKHDAIRTHPFYREEKKKNYPLEPFRITLSNPLSLEHV